MRSGIHIFFIPGIHDECLDKTGKDKQTKTKQKLKMKTKGKFKHIQATQQKSRLNFI